MSEMVAAGVSKGVWAEVSDMVLELVGASEKLLVWVTEIVLAGVS